MTEKLEIPDNPATPTDSRADIVPLAEIPFELD